MGFPGGCRNRVCFKKNAIVFRQIFRLSIVERAASDPDDRKTKSLRSPVLGGFPDGGQKKI